MNENEFREMKCDSNNNETNSNTKTFIKALNHRVSIDKSTANQPIYKIEILVPHFQPRDIQVKLNEKRLNIQARREILIKKDISNLKETEFFERDIDLPDFILIHTANCYLEQYKNEQNILVIEAVINEKFKNIEEIQSERQSIPPLKNQDNMFNRSKIDFDDISMNYIDNNESIMTNMCSDDFLKYKFDLKDVDSKNISITIKNKTVLELKAFKEAKDVNGEKHVKEFNHEITLPNDIEIFNIKNCFDEEEGILRIEIPVTKTSNAKAFNNDEQEADNSRLFSKDKYLELMFDLYDFKFENLQVYYDYIEKKKILLVRAYKFDKSLNRNRTNTRKFVLPDWISDKNINILEDEANINNETKNLLKLQFEIAE